MIAAPGRRFAVLPDVGSGELLEHGITATGGHERQPGLFSQLLKTIELRAVVRAAMQLDRDPRAPGEALGEPRRRREVLARDP